MGRRSIQMVSGLTRVVGLKSLIRISGQPFVSPFYHVVSDDPLPHIRHLYACQRPADFKRDLEQLLAIYEPVSLQDYLQQDNRSGAKPRMLLSFDDGLSGCHDIIAPILKQKGIPALFFLNNDFIDNKGLFYRYKASLLMEQILSDPETLTQAAAYLRISEPQVPPLLLTVSYSQQILLDRLAEALEYRFEDYQQSHPVYMSTGQIRELIGWGFDIGAHSMDHPQMERMEEDEVVRQVLASVMDLQERFRIRILGFAFPFSSSGIPGSVIRTLLRQGITLFGISGFRETGEARFIQRIDMEKFRLSAQDTLRIKYMRFILRKMTGRHRLDD